MYTAETWPIAAKMNFPARDAQGRHVNDAPVSVWADQIRQVADMGYKYIDPIDDWIQLADISDERFAEFCGLLDEFDVKVPAISFGRRSPIDDKNGQAHVESMHRMLDRGRELGAKIVNIGFMQALTPEQEKALWFWHVDGHKDDPTKRDLALERIRELGDHALRNDMEISLEIYEDTFLGSARDAVQFIEDCGPQGLGINPDFGNLIRLHREIDPWQESFDLVMPYINFWHIKNYMRDFDPATGAYFSFPVPLEDGLIDYRMIIRQAVASGYRGVFQTEHYGGDWLSVGAKNMAFIRGVLRNAMYLIEE
ncbi:sugar phosphate isomerase/epimerase family protein [Trueperella sp. LYQ141]|uniref:sugar phosphate isomerase/epimerase family protein n=1 Tax=Trueperella sp. LYQ141 TaxID=3391058 RepID=UPI0039836B9C